MPKLGKPWCKCCNNEQTFRAAEEVVDFIVQRHYMKPMCINSIQRAAGMADYMLRHVVAGKMADDLRKRKDSILGALPFGMARAVAFTAIDDKMEKVVDDVVNYMNKHDRGWETRCLQKLIAAQEIVKADEAFDRAKKD